jgi:hypothetical protein
LSADSHHGPFFILKYPPTNPDSSGVRAAVRAFFRVGVERALNPGVPMGLAQMATGFELLKLDGEIPVTPAPSDEVLAILRNEVDPLRVFTAMPGA